MSNLRPIDRAIGSLMPPVGEWLQEKHLARFVVVVIASLDLRAMVGRDRACEPHPFVKRACQVHQEANHESW